MNNKFAGKIHVNGFCTYEEFLCQSLLSSLLSIFYLQTKGTLGLKNIKKVKLT